MSVAIALATDTDTYVAADSLTSDTDNGNLFTRKKPKVAAVGGIAVAWTGSVSGCLEIIEHLRRAKTLSTTSDLRDAIRGFSVDGGRACFLVAACTDGIATIDHEMTVSEPYLEYCAVGFGDQAANGSLFSTVALDPMERLNVALCAAETHNTTVRGPFAILRIPRT